MPCWKHIGAVAPTSAQSPVDGRQIASGASAVQVSPQGVIGRHVGGHQGIVEATAARIGDPVSRDKVIREIVASNGGMQIASEEDLNAAVLVAGKDGFLVCPQTGMALAGVRNAVREEWIKSGERVVVVSTATGLKFTEAIAERVAKEIVTLSEASATVVAKTLGI